MKLGVMCHSNVTIFSISFSGSRTYLQKEGGGSSAVFWVGEEAAGFGMTLLTWYVRRRGRRYGGRGYLGGESGGRRGCEVLLLLRG